MEEKSNDLYRETVEKVKQDVLKQLPILEQNLESMDKQTNFILLPIVIHNICVIFERQAYKFIEPALNLWILMNPADVPEEIEPIVNKTIEILADLQKKECDLYEDQYKDMLEDKKKAKKEGRKFIKREEIKAFNHLEADMSSFFKKAIMLQVSGVYKFNHRQNQILKETYKLCIKILKEVIPQKRLTLKNTKKILGES